MSDFPPKSTRIWSRKDQIYRGRRQSDSVATGSGATRRKRRKGRRTKGAWWLEV
jgi:hypothetical protein